MSRKELSLHESCSSTGDFFFIIIFPTIKRSPMDKDYMYFETVAGF